MYSMQRQKLTVEPSVDQVKFCDRLSIIMNKIKLFKALKPDIFLKFQFQFYKTNIKV